MSTAYLSPSEASAINAERRNALATFIALQEGAGSLVLYRPNASTGGYDALPAQTVLIAYANRAQRDASSGAAQAGYVEGTFRKETPFDVKVGDTFAFGAQAGTITGVPLAIGGIQDASWRIDEGAP